MPKYLSFALSVLFACHASAGQWKRLSSEVLFFEGEIEEKVELQKLIENWDAGVRKLVVNSPGGHTVTGILMAQFLADKNFDIDVQGQCMSACANYLFMAAQQKMISKGVVGFHGNATAALYDLQDGMNFHTREQFTNDDIAQLSIFWDLDSREQLLELYTEYEMAVEIEKKLLIKFGVAQQLFDRSQSLDKGMNDGIERSFLLPKTQTFIKYGVKNVIGEQSLEILRALPVFVENAKLGFDVVID